jgi:glycosyl transferase family 25
MKVRLINLDRHPDRLAHMREQLAGIDFERLAAVEGAQSHAKAGPLTPAELGCLASHRAAWRLFLEGPDTHVCILEDDLRLQPGFADLLRDDRWIPADAHAVKLDTYLQKVRLGEGRSAPQGRELARLYTRHESSAAYVATRAGAERYLELTASASLPVDYAIFPKYPRRLGLRVYQLTPAIAIQDRLRPRRDGAHAFATAMTDREARRRPLAAKLRRESGRFVEQAADLAEAAYLDLVLKTRTTIVEAR